jgi:hypothetical protein
MVTSHGVPVGWASIVTPEELDPGEPAAGLSSVLSALTKTRQ